MIILREAFRRLLISLSSLYLGPKLNFFVTKAFLKVLLYILIQIWFVSNVRYSIHEIDFLRIFEVFLLGLINHMIRVYQCACNFVKRDFFESFSNQLTVKLLHRVFVYCLINAINIIIKDVVTMLFFVWA